MTGHRNKAKINFGIESNRARSEIQAAFITAGAFTCCKPAVRTLLQPQGRVYEFRVVAFGCG